VSRLFCTFFMLEPYRGCEAAGVGTMVPILHVAQIRGDGETPSVTNELARDQR
jgi:hypothetical protein